jgi:hypothetical protein
MSSNWRERRDERDRASASVRRRHQSPPTRSPSPRDEYPCPWVPLDDGHHGYGHGHDSWNGDDGGEQWV